MKVKSFYMLSVISASALGIVGCSSDSSSGPAPVSTPEVDIIQPTGTGVFLDSAVSGLDYEIFSSLDELISSGQTNDQGQFFYEVGGNANYIVFSLGDLELGRTGIADTITPLNFGGIDKHDDYALNVARFLQTLDDDGDPDNGIQISESTVDNFNTTYATHALIDFNQDTESFESVIAPRIAEYASGALVLAETAMAHLTLTVGTQSQVILDLNGTRWHGNTYKYKLYFLNDDGDWQYEKTCGDYPEGTGVYSIETYRETSIEAEMSDYFESDTCTTTSSAETFTYSYNKYSICPSRYCKYSDLNQVGPELWDSEDQRYEQVTKKHIPGTDEILSIKTIRYTQGYGHGDIPTKSISYTLYKRI